MRQAGEERAEVLQPQAAQGGLDGQLVDERKGLLGYRKVVPGKGAEGQLSYVRTRGQGGESFAPVTEARNLQSRQGRPRVEAVQGQCSPREQSEILDAWMRSDVAEPLDRKPCQLQ